ncbi:phosphoribosyltransferase family protein [Olleya sp. UBA1516]|uniref:phosphoribosyltransferase n=1 Tax=Olleya sp. UBA1516 TaxID=1947013 RepID=UPI0025CD8F6B|nr:phosphoribosyltransferase family protein [Olleya sp. UBA1516]|tara:strand:+ start:120531 stop:121109 length:579 start_codon:yes stop_codon:yes gene_type:complete
MKVLTLNTETFEKESLKLISKLEVNPDLVVGILSGGGHVLEAIKQHPNVKSSLFEVVTLQRQSTNVKQRFLKPVLSILPYSILNWLRILESNSVKAKISNLNLEKLQDNTIAFDTRNTIAKPIKNILIIDDAIDSGKTMFVVKSNLQQKFPKAKIKIAVLAWTIDSSIIKPDYYLYNNTLLRFPWSNDYKRK